MPFRTLSDLAVEGKTVLVRVDFNVPFDKAGRISDVTRIKAVEPTLSYLRERGCRTVLVSHLGRPEGTRNPRYSLLPVAAEARRVLGQTVQFAEDCVGEPAQKAVSGLGPGAMVLLENLRFHPEEEANDARFARQLADLAEVYVNDAFGTAHRAHASTVGVTRYLPSAAGLLMERELKALGALLGQPARPFVAIIGGAKVSSKLAVLKYLLGRVDAMLIGGGMANTFLKAQGLEVGASLLEAEMVGEAQKLLTAASERGVRVVLPSHVLVAAEARAGVPAREAPAESIPGDQMVVDVGPQALAAYAEAIRTAKTIFWNGPMGIFEVPEFAEGTRAVAQLVADSGAVSVVGGGESVAAVEQMGFADRITHVSTGGGATLEILEGRVLPGVAALEGSDTPMRRHGDAWRA